MVRARINAAIAALASFTAVLLFAGPAWAADSATYPPTGSSPTTSVEGVKSGVGGGVTESVSGGLASTGFDPAYIVVGVAVLAIGIALMLISRRRGAH